MGLTWLIIVYLILSSKTAFSCFFKKASKAPEDKLYSHNSPVRLAIDPWFKEEFGRRLNNDTNCVCGEEDDYQFQKNWFVYIHVNVTQNLTRTCPGTILTSNLVATSHQCLTFPGKRMNVYDTWIRRNPEGNIADVNEIKITSKLQGKGVVYEVVDVIYNFQYAYSSATYQFPVDDLVMIRVNWDFTSNESFHLPICIPNKNEIVNIVHQVGHYQGIGGDDTDPTKENRGITNALIFHADDCNMEGNLGVKAGKDILCIRFSAAAPKTEGGALRVDTIPDIYGITRAYLVGIATWVEKDMKNDANHKYALFTNIITMVRYIEYHAYMENSTWCKTPSMELATYWPWEVMRANNSKMSRTLNLNCTCGKTFCESYGNCDKEEFSWLAKISVTWFGDPESRTVCAGTIISDRIVLTAAHCVFNNEMDNFTKPENSSTQSNHTIEVYLNPIKLNLNDNIGHRLVDDIIFHPGYVAARKEWHNDFDIALLVLEKPINFSVKGADDKFLFQPVCLPTPGKKMSLEGRNTTVIGWGNKAEGNVEMSAELDKVAVSIRSIHDCAKLTQTIVTGTMLCSWTIPDTSGGGAVMVYEDGRYTQVGIVSWGEDVKKFSYDTDAWFVNATVSLFSNLEVLLPFVDYHSHRLEANWCKR